MRRFRLPLSAYVVIALIVIGYISRLLMHPEELLVPTIIFGVVFLLYKFPPHTLRRKIKKKEAPFRVIQGNKRNNDEGTPKYH
jgi:hypothetical protein